MDPTIAEQLVAQAREDGVDLVGPGGLSGELTKQVLETGLEVEMEERDTSRAPRHVARTIRTPRASRPRDLRRGLGPVSH